MPVSKRKHRFCAAILAGLSLALAGAGIAQEHRTSQRDQADCYLVSDNVMRTKGPTGSLRAQQVRNYYLDQLSSSMGASQAQRFIASREHVMESDPQYYNDPEALVADSQQMYRHFCLPGYHPTE
ncbi:hypothetical protein D6851_04945 [Altericroceibacterium spongiae]|uniref:Uncharacterized protein n=1 Tax=Altericroceibacterium spongiae TaxID=2320269 RepID=A0A420EPF8_9SPHN|nr:hypothetical protein [Altericroceibacterium spongiae]RKF22568.1 hypothetical protein D6851_04945 [Altericroceibacterium spongiae]